MAIQMEKGAECRKTATGQTVWYTGYLIVLVMVTVAVTLVTGSVLVYVQYTRAVQSLPRRIITEESVFDPDRYFKGRLTFAEREGGKSKHVTQEVFMDNRRREQILHIPGDKMDIYILQKFNEGKQMAVIFHTNSSTPEGSVVMCTEAPLEGTFVPDMHLLRTEGQDGDMNITESFHPATNYLIFKYRTCADIPKDMFSSDVSSSINASEEEQRHVQRKKREVPYGSWCGIGNGGLGQSCCPSCNADFYSCVAQTCAPLEDEVDHSCFMFKLCEGCTSRQQSGLQSCFCVKDFNNDLEVARCRSHMQPGSPPNPGSVSLDVHSNVVAPVDLAPPSVAGAAVPQPSPGPVDSYSAGAAMDHPLPAKAGIDPSIVAAAEAHANAELQATIADLKMEKALSGKPPVRRKRQSNYLFYDRRACMRYRSRTMTELKHQRCWCPVYIRVQYVCGYQQVAGSCKVTSAGEKCAVKYQTCSKIMSKNTLNAVNYKKCPSIS